MFGQAKGLLINKKSIINLVFLTLLTGLLAGGASSAINSNEEVARESEREAGIIGNKSEESNGMEGLWQLELPLLGMLFNELEEEQLQEVIEVLESWMRDHPEACPELRAAVEAALEEQGQGEASRGNTLEEGSVSNNNGTNNTNHPTGSSGGGDGGIRTFPGDEDFKPSPSVLCEGSHWVANTRPVYMLGTPGFWTPRHRCLICNFTTTCRDEALYHSTIYMMPSYAGGGVSGDSGTGDLEPAELPEIWDYNPYYKYTPGEPRVVIYIPDGTYTCMDCGKTKQRSALALWD